MPRDDKHNQDDKVAEFMAFAAHRLGAPLAAVKWLLHTLLQNNEGELNGRTRELLERAYSKNAQMIRFVDDLFIAERLDLDKLPYRPTRRNIEDMISAVVYDLQGRAAEKDIELNRDFPDKALPKVEADDRLMKIALSHLIENAIMYSPEGSAVDIKAELDDGEVKVSISDSGIGIPEADRDEVFDRFFRSENAKNKHTDGTGLGLYVAHRIVMAHKGRISFESEEGTGTTFYIALPVVDNSEE